mmetsp:Transcript_136622/g.436544  ORF Transcript_136622/g.436544 Transcript_136622/m.436544 type:complete len:403 (+) Transcript_136622:533-1741(+)
MEKASAASRRRPTAQCTRARRSSTLRPKPNSMRPTRRCCGAASGALKPSQFQARRWPRPRLPRQAEPRMLRRTQQMAHLSKCRQAEPMTVHPRTVGSKSKIHWSCGHHLARIARETRLKHRSRQTERQKASLPPKKIPKIGLQGAEVHTVFSYQGSAAAVYAKKVAEQRRAATERAPNRFEKTKHGTPRSVAVKFNMVAPSVAEASAVAAQTEHSAQKMGNSLEELQSDQPLRNLRDQEHLVAQWVHAVTGDQQADGVASGQSTLFDVLRSGEVLCDLINAIWPGKIVGIKRGQTFSMSPCSSRRRLTNVTLFVQACRNLGMDQQDMCTSSDLEDSQGLRNVMRCIFAIGALVPQTEFEGPRLVPWVAKDAFGAAAVSPLPGCQSSEATPEETPATPTRGGG